MARAALLLALLAAMVLAAAAHGDHGPHELHKKLLDNDIPDDHPDVDGVEWDYDTMLAAMGPPADHCHGTEKWECMTDEQLEFVLTAGRSIVPALSVADFDDKVNRPGSGMWFVLAKADWDYESQQMRLLWERLAMATANTDLHVATIDRNLQGELFDRYGLTDHLPAMLMVVDGRRRLFDGGSDLHCLLRFIDDMRKQHVAAVADAAEFMAADGTAFLLLRSGGATEKDAAAERLFREAAFNITGYGRIGVAAIDSLDSARRLFNLTRLPGLVVKRDDGLYQPFVWDFSLDLLASFLEIARHPLVPEVTRANFVSLISKSRVAIGVVADSTSLTSIAFLRSFRAVARTHHTHIQFLWQEYDHNAHWFHTMNLKWTGLPAVIVVDAPHHVHWVERLVYTEDKVEAFLHRVLTGDELPSHTRGESPEGAEERLRKTHVRARLATFVMDNIETLVGLAIGTLLLWATGTCGLLTGGGGASRNRRRDDEAGGVRRRGGDHSE